MREILLINPSRRRKRTKRKVRPMAKRRKRTYKRKPARRRARRNPSPKKRRSTGSRARGILSGLSFKKALKDMPAIQLGMFAAKWAAKRWDPDASETDPESWNWSSYLKGSLGAVLAGMLAGQFKGGSGQKVLEGGVNLMVYKAVQNELIAGSSWAAGQFGQDEYVPDEYEGMLLAGETDEGEAFMLGEDGEYYPADDQYRTQGDVLEPVGPLGQSPNRLEPVGPLGVDPYAQAWFE